MAKCWMLWGGTEYTVGYAFTNNRNIAKMACYSVDEGTLEYTHARVIRAKGLDNRERDFHLHHNDKYSFLSLEGYSLRSEKEKLQYQQNMDKLVALGFAGMEYDGEYIFSAYSHSLDYEWYSE